MSEDGASVGEFLVVSALADQPGLRLRDRIDAVQYELYTSDAPALRPGGESAFSYPVDTTVRFETAELGFPSAVAVFLRDAATGEPADGDHPGAFEIEVTSAPLKLYARVADTTVAVREEETRTLVRFGDRTEVVLGARSHHQKPAGTITVPPNPAGVMDAVSAFGAALQTRSPDRAYPTLRGHPPRVERGDTLDVPSELQGPSRERVEIGVPASYGAVFSVASLAYYLDAAVVPADRGYVDAAGVRVDLGESPRAISRVANDFLEHCFTLDSVVRGAGLYDLEYAYAAEVRERTDRDLDFDALYGMSLPERTAAYAETGFEDRVLTGCFSWYVTADVEPAAEYVVYVPHVVADLAKVRSPPAREGSDPDVAEDVVDFYRDGGATDRYWRSAGDGGPSDDEFHVLAPYDVGSTAHVWAMGDGHPVGASRPTVASYERAFDRTVPTDPTIDITIVCNDPEMAAETEGLYGFHDLLTFDIDLHFDLSVAELREVVRGDVDFLHYVGHVADVGMECSDGHLDLTTLDAVSTEAFLLNGCSSYDQGMALVDAGAIGGVVTMQDVPNRGAIRTGRALARLLDYGFNLHGALGVIRDYLRTMENYGIVGNGQFALSQANGVPAVVVLRSRPDEGVFDVRTVAYPTRQFGLGATIIPYWSSEAYPGCGVLDEDLRTLDELDELVGRSRVPLVVDGSLAWAAEVSRESLAERLD